MVQAVISAFYNSLRSVGGTLQMLAPAIATMLLATAAIGVLVWFTDRQRFPTADAIASVAKRVGTWSVLAILASVCWLTLQDIAPITSRQRNEQLQVNYTSREDPSVAGVLQYGPLASFVQEKTFTRTLTLPPAFVDRIGSEGIQTLSPYLQDPSASNVLKLVDSFRKSGRDVVFTRSVTRLDETPLQIERADVNVQLSFREIATASRHSFYDSSFDSTYVFRNPFDHPISGRFTFPLPEAGTVRDFGLTVNGESVTEPNAQNEYQWAGTLAAGATAAAKVHYRTQGGGAWRYDVSSGRRRIQSFALRMNAGETARFLRGSLYPTRREGDRMYWELKNTITNQKIDLIFPGRGTAFETRMEVLSFLPISLGLFLIGVPLVCWRKHLTVTPPKLILATVGFVLALGCAAVLLQYVIVLPAVVAAAAVGAALVWRSCGTWLGAWAAVPLLLPLVFTSELHSGLLAVLVAAALLLAIEPRASE